MSKQIISYMLAGLLAVTFAFFPKKSFSVVIYVDQNAVGADNGSNWTDAYMSLQDALQVAVAGDEIWVAQGVYKPDAVIDLNGSGGVDPREAVFFLPDGVALYGGFNGTEGALGERDWSLNLTVLSGDIDNNDANADGNHIAETAGDVAGNNSYHVIFTENASSSARLDGFIVTAGRADFVAPPVAGDPNQDGGGWYNRLSAPSWDSSPTIVNTAFTGNYAESEGGAFYSYLGQDGGTSSSLIENCRFLNNESNHSGGALFIGSFYNGSYNPEILNCQFDGNEAFRIGGAIYLVGDNASVDSTFFENNQVTAFSPEMNTLPGSGGAVAIVASNASFTACMFIDNSSTGNPTGASEGGGGGAVYVSMNGPQTETLGASMPTFTGCGFYNNTAAGNGAAWGGAINFKNDDGILQPTLVNCVFSENEAQNWGGAVFCYTRVVGAPEDYTPLLGPDFTNCTFFENTAGDRGGATYFYGYEYDGAQVLQAVVSNSILMGNDASVEGDQVYSTGDVEFIYTLVEGSGGSGVGWDNSLGVDGGNNIDDNSGFINPASPLGADGIPATNDDGLRLTQFADAVNAGDNSAAGLTGITEDYTGANRILGGVVDMGAYERSGLILPDFDFVWLVDWPGFQPPCLTCPLPWSFLLFREFEFEPEYIWKEPAKFVRKGKSAIITGEIVNVAAPEISFKVYLKLEREHTWETWSRQQGSWFSKTEESEDIAKTDHVNWKFWKLSTASYLEGTGEIKGVLRLKQWNSSEKTGFQMGMGANAWDSDFGLAGYFNYNGKLSYNGKKRQVKGLGSLNVDGIPCVEDCEEQFVQQKMEQGSTNGKKANLSADGFAEILILMYPVPADDYLVLESAGSENGIYTIKILDASGRVLLTEKWNQKENRHNIRLNKLNSGLHFIQIKSADTGKIVTEKFVKK